MTKFLWGAAAVVMTGAALAQAPAPVAPQAPQAPMARLAPMAPRMDRIETRDQVIAKVREHFAMLDANRDGFITAEEMGAMHVEHMDRMESMHGPDGNMTTREGPMGDRNAIFDRLDTNHDGNISRQEFTAGKPQVRTEQVIVMRDGAPGAPGAHPPMEGRDGMRMHMRHMGGMGMGIGMGAHLLEMADANHDGRVSLAEAQAAALAHFDKADLNHDGKITPDERQQGRQIMRIERRQG